MLRFSVLKRKKTPLNAKKLQKSASTTHLRVEALDCLACPKKTDENRKFYRNYSKEK